MYYKHALYISSANSSFKKNHPQKHEFADFEKFNFFKIRKILKLDEFS